MEKSTLWVPLYIITDKRILLWYSYSLMVTHPKVYFWLLGLNMQHWGFIHLIHSGRSRHVMCLKILKLITRTFRCLEWKKKKEESPGLWKEVEEGCFINIFAQIYSKCFCKMILGIRLFILTKYLYALFSDKLNCTVI